MPNLHRGIVICLGLTIFSCQSARGADIDQDFSNDLLLDILRLNPAGRQWSHKTPRGLLITIPGNRTENVSPAGVLMRKPITGDFEATLEYELLTAEEPDTGYGSGVVLWVRPEGPLGKFSIGRAQITGVREGSFFTAYCATLDKEPAKGKKHYFPTQSRVGGLRLVRTGTTVSYHVSDGDGPYREIHQEEFGAVPIQEIALYADTGRALTALEVLLKRFRLRAAAIADPPATVPDSTHGRPMTGPLLVVAVIAVAILLAWIWRMRRRLTPQSKAPA